IEEAKEFAKQRGINIQGDLVRVVAEAKSPGTKEKADAASYGRSSHLGRIRGQRDDLQASLLHSMSRQIEAFGGKVETTHRRLLQSVVPLYALQDLAGFPSIKYLRQPRKPIPFVMSEGVEKTDADQWHTIISYRSTEEAKVCILDLGFQGYEALLGTELPSSVITRSFRADGDLSVSDHGTACAEIVHDMAPDAELWLVNFGTDVEHHNAVNWIIDQGVDVISCSVGWANLGAGDGTGPICEEVKNAHNNGIIWVSASGNEAERHWEGTFKDSDSDNWCNFEDPGQPEDEWFAFYVFAGNTYQVLLNWDDWGTWSGSNYNFSEGNDYDLFLYDSELSVIASSNNDQTAGALPEEAVTDTAGSSGWRYIRIYKWLAPRDCKLELFFLDGSNLEYIEPAGSLAIPADSPFAVAVGATDWTDDSYHVYRSQGPTSDMRIKPDLAAPSGVSGSTYGDFGFFGTSASASHVAGAFALLKGKLPYTLDEIKSIIETRAKDLGSTGKDNIFGLGRLKLSSEIEDENQLRQEEAEVHKSGLTSNKNNEVIVSRGESKKSVVERSGPDYFRDRKFLGWIFLQYGYKEKALEKFLKAIELEPWSAEPCFEVAKIYNEKGEKRKAIFYLEKYFYLGGREEAAKELLESLKKKQAK
ncbi:MAG: S8 family serine peptidase, partial [Candidatus Aminicenantes bacterium]|nr:S8 family serine peptidase [Candidatus Aminicenantes bacterium]